MRFRRAKDEEIPKDGDEDGDAPLHADPEGAGEADRPPPGDAGGLSLKFTLRAGESERPPDTPS
jgi:hypothetical protein